MLVKCCHLHSSVFDPMLSIGISELISIVASFTLIPRIHTEQPQRFPGMWMLPSLTYVSVPLVCMPFSLGSYYVYLQHGYFYSCHDSSDNRICLWWVLREISIPFQDICPIWGCHRVFEQKTANLRHWKANNFHW